MALDSFWLIWCSCYQFNDDEFLMNQKSNIPWISYLIAVLSQKTTVVYANNSFVVSIENQWIHFVSYHIIKLMPTFRFWCSLENISNLLFHCGCAIDYWIWIYISAYATFVTNKIVCEKLARNLSKCTKCWVSWLYSYLIGCFFNDFLTEKWTREVRFHLEKHFQWIRLDFLLQAWTVYFPLFRPSMISNLKQIVFHQKSTKIW